MDPALCADDLAPGDRRGAPADVADLRVARVADAGSADFAEAYAALWREFGARGEMESEAVIRERLAWDPSRPRPGAALAYDLLVVRRRDALVALRDHSAVVRLDARGKPAPGPVVVHLSHAWVAPAERGRGLAGWLRALPLATARRCAAAAGARPDAPLVLAAEMEAPDAADPATGVRLRSYARAGFRKIDPAAAPYAQPDFHPPAAAADTPPQSVPLCLVVRRVGREAEDAMPASEVAAVVEALYSVYAAHLPAHALEPLRRDAAAWTRRADPFRLLEPTA